MSNKLTVGRQLHALVDPRINGGHDVAPAIVTSVHEVEGEDEKTEERANLRVFLDTGADLRYSDVVVFDKRPKKAPSGRVAFWPPR